MSHRTAPSEPLTEPITVGAFKAEVMAWAEKIRVQPAEVHVRPMKRKWASCSSRGRLTFDTDLLSEPESYRADVIVHELLHLKVPNHGPLFRSLMRAYSASHSGSIVTGGTTSPTGVTERSG